MQSDGYVPEQLHAMLRATRTPTAYVNRDKAYGPQTSIGRTASHATTPGTRSAEGPPEYMALQHRSLRWELARSPCQLPVRLSAACLTSS